jgi:hypothetical protein
MEKNLSSFDQGKLIPALTSGNNNDSSLPMTGTCEWQGQTLRAMK